MILHSANCCVAWQSLNWYWIQEHLCFWKCIFIFVCTKTCLSLFFQSGLTYAVGPTELRLNETYIIYVYFGMRLIITSIIPFVALAILNSLIYISVRRRRNILGKIKLWQAWPQLKKPILISMGESFILVIVSGWIKSWSSVS